MLQMSRYAGGESSSSASRVATGQEAAGAVAPKSKGSAYVQEAIHKVCGGTPPSSALYDSNRLRCWCALGRSTAVVELYERVLQTV